MFLPVIILRIGWKKSLSLMGIVVFVVVLGFQPFVDAQLIANISDSLGKYYTNFEFNGGVYYLVRWCGILQGYNPIGSVGPVLPVLAGLVILLVSWKKRNENHPLLAVFSIIWMVYYLFSTTVNSWYIAVLVPLSIFSNSKASWIWVATIPLSYLAYSWGGVEESTWVLVFEYSPVYLILAYELKLFRWFERKWALRKAKVKSKRLSQFYVPNEST